MKNLAIVSLLFVLMSVCALPAVAQKKQQPGTKSGKPVMTAQPQPAPTPATSATKPATEQSGVIHGRVVDLGWGDALTVQDAQSKQHRVRLLGIDAPEKEQAFGPAARQKLSAMVFGKTVTVKYQKTDRNGRPLGQVTMGALDINLEMLKAGLAWYYPNDRDLPESDRPRYSGAEQEARAASRGLWQDEVPVSPWDFRQARRQQPAAPTPPPGMEPTGEPAQVASETPPEKSPDVVTDKPVAPGKSPEPASDQPDASASFPKSPKLSVTGDSSTRTYYKAGCPEGDNIPPQHRVSFNSIEEAEKAGFKRTPNCP